MVIIDGIWDEVLKTIQFYQGIIWHFGQSVNMDIFDQGGNTFQTYTNRTEEILKHYRMHNYPPTQKDNKKKNTPTAKPVTPSEKRIQILQHSISGWLEVEVTTTLSSS